MKRKFKVGTVVAAASALSVAGSAAAHPSGSHHPNAAKHTHANNSSGSHRGFVCSGTLESGAYKRITVPSGATCDGTNATITVRGGVRVGTAVTLILGSEGHTVGGTISGGLRAN